AALAIAAARHFRLPIGESEMAEGLRTVDWPARLMPLNQGRLLQLLSPGQELWLDGGHNEAGGRVLAAALRELDRQQRQPLVLIMGTFANKDAAGYLGHFGELPRQVYTVPIPGDRAAWPARTLAGLARSLGLAAEPRRSVEG